MTVSFIGYSLALLMGLTLGMIGAGGSILTMPILVYFFGIPPVTAAGYSLLIVGLTALVGTWSYYKKNQIDFKVTFLFSIPAIIAVYISRRFLVPIIPLELFSVGDFVLTKNSFIMLLFALLMLLASVMMIMNKRSLVSGIKTSPVKRIILIAIEGFVVGIITGIVGAGGGFLIIPALVLLAGLDMRTAIGSSLLIISLKSLIGFIGDLQTGIYINYTLLLTFLFLSSLGLIVGSKMSSYFSAAKLKRIFGLFTLLIGVTIIIKEF